MEYKYTLIYEGRGTKLTYEFPADIGGDRLAEELRNFLCGCSWSEDNVKEIIQCE